MKKKGFTLVELLAVIAILAILVIIALPNVLSMFNSAKKSTFKTEVQSIFKQAQTDFIEDSIKSSGAQVYCDATTKAADTSCTDTLQLTTTKQYYVKMDSQGNILRIGVKDNSFVYGLGTSTSTTGLNINQIDETKISDASKSEGTGFVMNNTVTTGQK